jgi:hypothetical protein
MATGLERFVVDHKNLPPYFPTHGHSAAFWEALGRTVATFGFLEEVLGKAIFAFTATKPIPPEKAEAEFEKWLPTLKRALSDPLGGLIDTYGKAIRDRGGATTTNVNDLLNDLRKACQVRNVLCHGSWRVPDDHGRSLPFFVDKRQRIFTTRVDVAYLQQVQRHAGELIIHVINTVTHMGYQFPGSRGRAFQFCKQARLSE